MGTNISARRASLPISYSQRVCSAMGSATCSMDCSPLHVGCEEFKMRTGLYSGRIIEGMQAIAGQLEEANQASKGVLRQVKASQCGSHVFLWGQMVIGRHAMIFQQVFQLCVACNDRLPGVGVRMEFPQSRLHGASYLANLRILRST